MQLLLRRAWFVLALCALTLFWGLVATLAALLRPRGSAFIRCGRSWARGLLAAAGVEVRVDGLGHLEPDCSYIFVCNHQSHFDVLALLHALPFDLRAVTKQELARVPLFGWALTAAGFIFVDRSNRERAIASLKRAGEILRSGRSILYFAEGTRSPDGSLLPFKKGGFVMALETETPIVPVAITGSRQVLPKHALSLQPGSIRVRTMPPLSTAGRGVEARDALIAETRQAIEQGKRELSRVPEPAGSA
ncbi:MAG: lysophospholipid acyltransferase family protein [Acidobacteriota bacterium]